MAARSADWKAATISPFWQTEPSSASTWLRSVVAFGHPNAELQAAVSFLLLHFQKGSSDVAHVWSCEGAQIAFTDPNGPSPKLIGELARLVHQSSQPGHHKVSGRWREQIRDTIIVKASKLLGQLVVERQIQAPHPE